MWFEVLGPLAVTGPDGPVALGTPKNRAVLAVLLARGHRPVSAAALVDAVWHGRIPKNAPKNIHVHVHRLRRALGGGERILFADGGYRLVVADDELDAWSAQILGRQAQHARSSEEAGRLLREALGLWRGDAFTGYEDLAPVRPEADRLAELRMALLERRIDADLASGRHAELVAELAALTVEHPLREHFHGRLMLALYRSGRQADALARYRQARRTLIDELGLEPGPELRDLERRMLDADPSLDAGPPRPVGRTTAAPLRRPPVPAQLPSDLRSFTGGRRVLILLDDASGAGQVRPLLPASAGSLALVTSRNSLRGLVARDDACSLTLTGLSPAEALALLEQLLGERAVRAERAAAGELARRCDHLPLALRIATTRITGGIGAYLARLTERDILDELSLEDDPDTAVRHSFDRSYAVLDPEQKRLFRLLSLAADGDVALDVVEAAALAVRPVPETRRLLDQLSPAADRYRLTGLLRIYAAEHAARANSADQDEGERPLLAARGTRGKTLGETGR